MISCVMSVPTALPLCVARSLRSFSLYIHSKLRRGGQRTVSRSASAAHGHSESVGLRCLLWTEQRAPGSRGLLRLPALSLILGRHAEGMWPTQPRKDVDQTTVQPSGLPFRAQKA